MSDVEEVIRQIRLAFPSEPYREMVTSCDCDECTEVDRCLEGRRWDEVSGEVVDAQFGSLPLLSPPAFQAFLPAWLLRSLDQLDARFSDVREWTLFSLGVYQSEDDRPEDQRKRMTRLVEREERFSADQITAVRAFLKIVMKHSAITDLDRASIIRALDLVWLVRES